MTSLRIDFSFFQTIHWLVVFNFIVIMILLRLPENKKIDPRIQGLRAGRKGSRTARGVKGVEVKTT
jgi:hypothetical protein